MDRRRHARHEVQLPVELGWGEGVTRDMSVAGAYIEAPIFDVPVGETFNFAVKIGRAESGTWTLKCRGLVIRIDQKDDQVGVAVSIDRYLEIDANMTGLETSH